MYAVHAGCIASFGIFQAGPDPVSAGVCCAADASGFLLINEYLQSAGGPSDVFAVGDVASSVTDPRPKAGVYAVRQVGAAVLLRAVLSACAWQLCPSGSS